VIKQDEELDRLEEDIRRLKNKFDQFFNGITKVPPSFEKHQVEAMVHELSKQKMRDNTRRFRFNTILSRYNQYRELWGRKMREREEGPLDFRRRQAAMNEPPAAPAPPPQTPRGTSEAPDPYVRMRPGANGDEIRRIYETIERENAKLGNRSTLTMEQLEEVIRKQSEMLRTKYKVSNVGFRVETIDGKVKLKAKPFQD
jgi:hypothetical protein